MATPSIRASAYLNLILSVRSPLRGAVSMSSNLTVLERYETELLSQATTREWHSA